MGHLPAFFLLTFLLTCLILTHASFCAGDDHFVYSGFAGAGAANLTVDGSARVNPEGLLELTNGMPNIKGHAFYPTPFQFKKSPNGTVQSFRAAFVFGIVSAYPDVSTDGMAFFIAPSKNFSGAMPAQYLGLFSNQTNGNASDHIFAIELDTIQNSEFQDIDNNHVGIDINNLCSLQSNHSGFYDDNTGAFTDLSLGSCKAMRVWVNYDGDARQINVTLAPTEVPKPVRPLLSTTYDLSAVITAQAYIGFSAATGPFGSRHCVLGWSFGMDAPAPVIEIDRLPKLPCSGHKATTQVLEIVLPIATAALILAACITVILVVRRCLRYAELREDWEVEYGPHRFSYKDLFNATEGFRDKHILGAGGFGKVYKGVLPTSKMEVAVKKVSHGSSQGMKEFISEVVSIGHLRHRNLVQLLGYCRRKGELLLVYDYMSNGSLDKYLYGEEGESVLDWPRRFQIIKDVAAGLFYLHEKWEQVVIHRDIKASNVLLDSEMNGRLGDFGLARLYDHGGDPQSTQIVGTMGYLAPELARTGKASPLTDVFAFGTFLLEVTCGQRPISNGVQHGRQLLVDWVLQHWQRGSLTETVDPRLQDGYNGDEACLVLRLGLLCSHPFPDARPLMRHVMQYLDGDMPLPELMPDNLSFSLLTLMQSVGFDPYAAQHPWSVTSLGSSTPDISVGR